MVLITSCTEGTKKNLLIAYQKKIDFPTNPDYNGIDTSLLLVNGVIIKAWNKYDDQFSIIDLKTNTTKRYVRNPIDNIKYVYDVIDTNNYKVSYQNDKKLILGYNCKKAIITTYTDTTIVYYTNELGINYSPRGPINGFVLESHYKSSYSSMDYIAISIEENIKEKYAAPIDYIETSQDSYLTENRKFYCKENQKKLVKENQKAPFISIPDINNNLLNIDEKNGKVLVFNYWSIGCKPCVMEFPELNKLVGRFNENKSVEFYAFTGDSKSQLFKFLPKKRFDFNIVPNARHIHHLYGINAFPTTLIIDKKGNISKIYTGMIDEDNFENIVSEIKNYWMNNNQLLFDFTLQPGIPGIHPLPCFYRNFKELEMVVHL